MPGAIECPRISMLVAYIKELVAVFELRSLCRRKP